MNSDSQLEKKSIVLFEGDFDKAKTIADSGEYGQTSASNVLRMFFDREALIKKYNEIVMKQSKQM